METINIYRVEYKTSLKARAIFMHLTIIIFNRRNVVPFETNRPSHDLLVSSFQLKWSIEMWSQSTCIEKKFLLSL